jgi:gluconate 2-dehydrogenase gamma chain
MGGTAQNRRGALREQMSEQNESRRAFLKGAVAGAGAVASAAVVPEALAQNRPADAHAEHAQSGGAKLGAFFNPEEAATITVFTERLMPGAPGKPGATEAAVLNYIDLALAGAYSDAQEFYRHGLNQLDAYCRATYKRAFAQLDAKTQDETIAALENGKASGFSWPTAQAFFNTLRTHTMEGMFADPVYGGNKDFAGWRLVGFPGAQPTFRQAEMQSKAAYKGGAIVGLQATRKA